MTENIHGIDPWNWSIYILSILYRLFKFNQNDTNKFLRYTFSSVTACFRNGVRTNVLSAKKTIIIWHEYDYIDTDIVVFPFASLYCDFPDDYSV